MTNNSEQAVREFWINVEFAREYPDENCSRYPAFDRDLNKKHHVHVIEYSAFQKLKEELARLEYEQTNQHEAIEREQTIIELQQENERLKNQKLQLQQRWEETAASVTEARTYISELLEQIKMLTEALEFYGDEGNYNWHYYGQDKQRVSDEVTEDGGKRARKTLAKLRQGGDEPERVLK